MTLKLPKDWSVTILNTHPKVTVTVEGLVFGAMPGCLPIPVTIRATKQHVDWQEAYREALADAIAQSDSC